MTIQDLTGQTLGQYELRELLGMGGMGAVYRGYQTSLKRYVAVKVLSAQLVQQPGAVERFNREAETSAALEHPNIIHIHDYGTQRGITYLVMQLLTGGTLAERLEQRSDSEAPLPSLGEISNLLKQLASALDYAHRRGVIHRDIKPSNVMFDNHGNAYLVDFGIAKLAQATSGLTASGTVIGTWGFMAPEQWRAEELTAATDQYAMAVMTYALVTGQMPFDAPTPAGIMHKHLNVMPTPPHTRRIDAPQAVTQVIERALAKSPESRFPTVTAFAQAFDKAIRGQTGEVTNFFTTSVRRKPLPTSALMPSQPVATTQPIYKHPAVWGLVAVVIVMATVIAFLILGGSNQKKSERSGTTAAAQIASDTPTSATSTLSETSTRSPGILVFTVTPLSSNTLLPTLMPTPSATETPGLTVTHTPTVTFTPTTAPAIVIQPSDTPAPTLTMTSTATQMPTPTWTALPTRTPAPTHTPDLQVTANALLVLHLTQTAENWTDTPTLTEMPTQDLLATAEVIAVAGMTATAEAWTDTPSPTVTKLPQPSDTPEPTATRPSSVIVASPASPTLSETNIAGTVDAEMELLLTENVQTAAAALTQTAMQWTATPSPDLRGTAAARLTATQSAADTATADTDTPTLTATATSTHTPTATRTQTWTPTVTQTPSPSATLTQTPSLSATSTQTPSPSATYTSTPTPTSTASPTLSPTPVPKESDLIAFASDRDGDYEIYTMKIDGSDVRQITFNSANDFDPTWSPDGSRIAFMSDRDGDFDIYITDSDGDNTYSMTSNSVDDGHPAWSPDGTRIAFESQMDGDREIYVTNPDGDNLRQLTHNDSSEWWATWSPDGQQIAFYSDRDGNREIYMMDSDGGNVEQLTFNDADNRYPDWSPSGTQIAFASTLNGNWQIFVMDVYDRNLHQLTNLPGTNWGPAWSPDGTNIIFVSDQDGDNEIYLMAADGGRLRQITSNGAKDEFPVWKIKFPY